MSGETPDERREAAATRRRWISLAEAVAVAGVLIGALSLWMTWSDRRADERARTQATQQVAREQGRFDLRGVVQSGGDRIALLRDDRHELRDVSVAFPSALGVATKDAVDLSISKGWFEKPLLAVNTKDDAIGRLPVLVTYTYTDDDRQRTRTALYDIVWTSRGRFLRGRTLTLTGLRSRGGAPTQAGLDASWVHERS